MAHRPGAPYSLLTSYLVCGSLTVSMLKMSSLPADGKGCALLFVFCGAELDVSFPSREVWLELEVSLFP